MERLALDNPYWDAVKDYVSECPVTHRLEVGRPNYENPLDISGMASRYEYVPRYAWTITDPGSVFFVAEHADGKLFDPMAGTGYWAHMLRQLGVDVICYDREPPAENPWHKGHKPFGDITQMDCVESARLHPDRAMLLSWPPYGSSTGAMAIKAYRGNKIIFVGDGRGGCTGDGKMFDLLDKRWKRIANHRPVQWWGIHDLITVYRRRGRSEKG